MKSLETTLSPLRDAAVLLLWGSAVFLLAGTGKLALYLHPSLQPFTIAGGALLILLAGFSLTAALPRRGGSDECRCGHDHGEHHHDHEGHLHDDGHGHHHGGGSLYGQLSKTVILLLPVVAAYCIGSAGYTSSTVRNRGVVGDLSKLPSANAVAASSFKNSPVRAAATSDPSVGTAMPLQLMDILYALEMPSYREEFEGYDVELIAQYLPMSTGNPKGDRFQAVRMFMTCCAADVKPLGITVRTDQLPKVPEMGWLRITGKPVFTSKGGKNTVILEASKLEPCDAPSEPFVY